MLTDYVFCLAFDRSRSQWCATAHLGSDEPACAEVHSVAPDRALQLAMDAAEELDQSDT